MLHYIEEMDTRTSQTLQLKNMAYIFYNLEIEGIYDPSIYKRIEAKYRMAEEKYLTARHCYAALRAYYRSNQGSLYGIDFWEA